MANQNDADGLLSSDLLEQEIEALQRELGRLKHYTDDIGKARDASDKVMQASERFVSAFQSHIKSLVEGMEKSSAKFEQTCATSSEQLHKASVRFNADIDRSQKLLDVLGKQLDATAVRVEQMTGEIRQMDIPGRFSEVNKAVVGVETKALEAEQRVKAQLDTMVTVQARSEKRSTTRFVFSTALTVVAIALLIYLITK